MSIQSSLTTHLEKIGTAPFLFVGSGLSRRYVELEDWERLLCRFSKGLPKPFEYYKAAGAGVLPEVAKQMARAFYDVWWNEKDYDGSRNEFKSELQNNESCLKFEVAKYIREKKI